MRLHRDPAVAVTASLSGQGDDGPGQSIFVVSLRWLVALRAALLIHELARMSLAHSMLTGIAHRTPPSFRAKKPPEAMSFNTSLSRLSSATRRFS